MCFTAFLLHWWNKTHTKNHEWIELEIDNFSICTSWFSKHFIKRESCVQQSLVFGKCIHNVCNRSDRSVLQESFYNYFNEILIEWRHFTFLNVFKSYFTAWDDDNTWFIGFYFAVSFFICLLEGRTPMLYTK